MLARVAFIGAKAGAVQSQMFVTRILRASPVSEVVKVAQTPVDQTPWLVSVEEVIHLGPHAFCKVDVKVAERQKYMREEPLIAISARELV